jgi:hypothetical protein
VIFRENRQLGSRKPKFVANDLDVVLADQRCPPRYPPARSVIDCRLSGVREAAAEFRMLDLLQRKSETRPANVSDDWLPVGVGCDAVSRG